MHAGRCRIRLEAPTTLNTAQERSSNESPERVQLFVIIYTCNPAITSEIAILRQSLRRISLSVKIVGDYFLAEEEQ